MLIFKSNLFLLIRNYLASMIVKRPGYQLLYKPWHDCDICRNYTFYEGTGKYVTNCYYMLLEFVIN